LSGGNGTSGIVGNHRFGFDAGRGGRAFPARATRQTVTSKGDGERKNNLYAVRGAPEMSSLAVTPLERLKVGKYRSRQPLQGKNRESGLEPQSKEKVVGKKNCPVGGFVRKLSLKASEIQAVNRGLEWSRVLSKTKKKICRPCGEPEGKQL